MIPNFRQTKLQITLISVSETKKNLLSPKPNSYVPSNVNNVGEQFTETELSQAIASFNCDCNFYIHCKMCI